MTIYKFVRGLLRIYLSTFYRLKIYGHNNIPNDGPVVVIANHISNFDPLVVGSAIERQVHFLAKEELFRVPVLSWLVDKLGAFPIKRGQNDLRAIKKGLELLKQEKVIGVFPEGTRSKTGELGEGLPGAALFALKSNSTVIPIGIKSDYKFFKPIIVNIGEPISLEGFKAEKIKSDDLTKSITYMMAAIKIQVNEADNK